MTDLSQLTDEQLLAAYQKPDLSTVSDADLLKAYGNQEQKPKFGLGDTWPARLAKALYSGLTLPGDVAQGNVSMTGEDGHTNPEVINRSADLASIASPLSPAARLGVGWAGALKTKPNPGPSTPELYGAADKAYDQARNLGVELSPKGLQDTATAISQHLLNDRGITADTAKQTFKTLDKLGDIPDDALVTVPNLLALRQHFGEIAGNFNKPTDQRAAITAKRYLDDYMASLTDQEAIRGPASQVSTLLKEGNGNYAAASRSEQAADAFKKLSDQNNATHSAGNLNNKTKQYFAKFLNDDKVNAGFNDPEMAQAQSIVDGSTPERLMHGASKFFGGGGGLGMAHGSVSGAGLGAYLGGPLGAAVGAVVPPAIGYGLRKGAESLTSSKVEAFQRMVRNRSPLGESMPKRVTGKVSPRQALAVRALLMGSHPVQQDQ